MTLGTSGYKAWGWSLPAVAGLAVIVLLLIAGLIPERIDISKGAPLQQFEVQQVRSPTAKQPEPERSDGRTWLAKGWESYSKDVKWTDIAVAIFTGVLTWVAWLQIRYSRINQRAYISVEPDGIRPHRRQQEGEPKRTLEDLTGHFLITNVGHLPARDVSWYATIECVEQRHRRLFPVEEDKFGGSLVVTPGTKMRRATPTIPNFEFNLFNEERPKYCFVWGQVRYRDGYGTLRTTNFCHRYNCDALLDDNEIPERHARYHEYGNDGT